MHRAVETFLGLRPVLREVREDGGWIFAVLDYDWARADTQRLLADLHNNGVISEIRRAGKLVFPNEVEGSATLDLRIDTGNLPGYFESYDSLIKSHPDAAPEEFYVWEEDAALHAGYRAACELLRFLSSRVEVWDVTAQRFFLVDRDVIEIPLTSYSAGQTRNIPARMESLTRFLDDRHLDADARWAFFRKASLRLLRNVPTSERLGVLMERLESVLERATQDHSLYLERFSFEDLLKNFDEKRLKFVSDLNQFLASIQTALIAVPIGFFLVAEKFKAASGLRGQNIVLAAGGLVFFALLLILSLNQGKTLLGIKLALAEFETEQKKRWTEKSERLRDLLDETWGHYRRVRLLLWLVRVLLLLFAGVVVTAFLWCSSPAWQRCLPYAVDDLPKAPQHVLQGKAELAQEQGSQ